MKIHIMEDNHQGLGSKPHATEPIRISRLPNLPLLLGRTALKSGSYRVGDDLPCLNISVAPFYLNSENLQRYREICGFQSQQIPATYLIVVAFPLFIRLLLDKSFPLRPMGLVHLRNQITVEHAFEITSPISITAAVGASELTSRGLEWNIDTFAQSEGQTVWSARSTFLHRCKTEIKRQAQEPIKPTGEIQEWQLPADSGRRYARVSGDYNPIHLTDMTAKLLGFKRAIAHGMWSKARCLATLEKDLPDAGYQVNASFHKPIFLPSSVRYYSEMKGGEQDFYLFNGSGSDMHLQCSIL